MSGLLAPNCLAILAVTLTAITKLRLSQAHPREYYLPTRHRSAPVRSGRWGRKHRQVDAFENRLHASPWSPTTACPPTRSAVTVRHVPPVAPTSSRAGIFASDRTGRGGICTGGTSNRRWEAGGRSTGVADRLRPGWRYSQSRPAEYRTPVMAPALVPAITSTTMPF